MGADGANASTAEIRGGYTVSDAAEADIRSILPQGSVFCHEPMSRHTTFRVGGPAAVFASPAGEEELAALMRYLRENGLLFTVIGNGSNLLVSDSGFDGIVVQIGRGMNRIDPQGDRIFAQAGAMISAIARRAMEESLTGMEPESGIPGSLGGALSMNAGAYGGEMKDITRSVRVLTKEGEILEIDGCDMEFGYRTSRISREGMIALSAVLQLSPSDRESVFARMEELRMKRTEKQPLEYPSAGSTFKRPSGYFAGALIDQSGLRGYRRGGAMVSDKHCGFVINADGASAEDIRELMRDVRRIVYEHFGVRLEPEVRMLGFSDEF